MCPACAAELPRLPSPGCPVCARPTPLGETCGACLVHPPRYDTTHAVWSYAFPVDRLIHALKYAHRLASADFLGRAMADALPDGPPPDLILPVPLAPTRLKERGFNQAIELARPLAARIGRPMLLHEVRRTRDTPAQAGLPWRERAKNVRHAFECQRDLSGLSILVIDDVMTTGATLDELARTLKAHGAARVTNLVAARALPD